MRGMSVMRRVVRPCVCHVAGKGGGRGVLSHAATGPRAGKGKVRAGDHANAAVAARSVVANRI